MSMIQTNANFFFYKDAVLLRIPLPSYKTLIQWESIEWDSKLSTYYLRGVYPKNNPCMVYNGLQTTSIQKISRYSGDGETDGENKPTLW